MLSRFVRFVKINANNRRQFFALSASNLRIHFASECLTSSSMNSNGKQSSFGARTAAVYRRRKELATTG